ncbi:MAG: DUF2207 domain-containing protein [Ardenticatenales bacterium]|nr:DUF2207 domain-containing protein [Ardenticatenales bacterium]
MRVQKWLISLFLLALLIAPSALQAQVPALVYERYDVDIAVQPDGSFVVRETQRVRFDGEFSSGFAEIPTLYTEGIQLRSLTVDGVEYREGDPELPQQYGLTTWDDIALDWGYPPTTAGDRREFVIEYVVIGGLWVYDDFDALEWRAVPADRSGIPVEQSRVTVRLPAPLSEAEMLNTVFSPNAVTTTQPEPGLLQFEAAQPLPDGIAFHIQVAFPHGIVSAQPPEWQRRAEVAALEYEQSAFNAELTIHPDGTLAVVDRETITVQAGVLRTGARLLEWDYLDEISNIRVAEGELPLSEAPSPCENCYQVGVLSERPDPVAWYDATRGVIESRFGQQWIEWEVPPLVAGESTDFIIRYDVAGAIVPSDEGQTLTWQTGSGQSSNPAQRSRLTVNLPDGVDATQVTVAGATAISREGQRLVIAPPPEAVYSDSWTATLTLPPNATSAVMPRWGADFEAARRDVEAVAQARARQQLLFGGAGILIFLAGLVGAWLLWFRFGRDVEAPLHAEYISEPPSKLPPAVVSYLLEERVTNAGVLSAIFDLAELGLLNMTFGESEITLSQAGPEVIQEGRAIELPQASPVTVEHHHLVAYYNMMAKTLSERPIALSEWFAQHGSVLPRLYFQMGVEAGSYFEGHPDSVRHRWLVFGQLLVLAAGVLGCWSLFSFLGAMGWLALAPAFGVAAAGIALISISRWMPKRTALGVSEADKWRAFQRYLLDIKSYGALESAQKIIDDYFAYAVALGAEKIALQAAGQRGAVVPRWTTARRTWPCSQPSQRWPTQNREATATPPVIASGRGQPTISPPKLPTLQSTSDSLARSIQSSSNALSSLLSHAAGSRNTPFSVIVEGGGKAAKLTWKASTSTARVLGEAMEAGGGSGGGRSSYGSSSRRSGSFGGGFRSSSRSSSGGSSSRSSSGRRSGGGGRRGFG